MGCQRPPSPLPGPAPSRPARRRGHDHRRAARSLLILALLAGCTATERLVDEPGRHRGLMRGDEQQGPWTYFHPDGSLRAQGEYRDDEQHGPWVYHYPPGPGGAGPVEWQIDFDEGHLDGVFRRLYRGGQPILQGAFEDDREQGHWSFRAPGGRLLSAGDFLDGLRSLRWTWYGDDGEPRVEGYFHAGRRVGPWTYRDAAGQEWLRALPLPRDVQLVRDTWPGGGLRREGFLVDGEPDGVWVSWHRSGGRRVVGRFDDGEAVGTWTLLDPGGALLATGAFDDDEPVGEWTVALDGGLERLPIEALPAPRAPAGDDDWSPDLAASQDALGAVAAWLGELSSAARPAEWPGQRGGPVPAELVDVGVERPSIPVPPQPWRARELADLPAMVSLYTGGGAAPKRRGGGVRDPYGGRRDTKSRGRTELSEPLVGKPLPVDTLVTPDGPIALSSLAGRKIALVVMRGFDGEVCVYCAAQTQALEENRQRFEDVGAEVLVVYPGDGDDLDTFLSAYRTIADEGLEPSYALAFDPAFELVQALAIEGTKAMPTTLLLDEQGIVRWAYVGEDKVDRPSVERMVGVLKTLPGS